MLLPINSSLHISSILETMMNLLLHNVYPIHTYIHTYIYILLYIYIIYIHIIIYIILYSFSDVVQL